MQGSQSGEKPLLSWGRDATQLRPHPQGCGQEGAVGWGGGGGLSGKGCIYLAVSFYLTAQLWEVSKRQSCSGGWEQFLPEGIYAGESGEGDAEGGLPSGLPQPVPAGERAEAGPETATFSEGHHSLGGS